MVNFTGLSTLNILVFGENDNATLPIAFDNDTTTMGDVLEDSESSISSTLLVFIGLGLIMSLISLVGVVTNGINIFILSYIAAKVRTPTYHILIGVAISDLGTMLLSLCLSLRFFARIPYIQESDLGIPPDNLTVHYATYFFLHTWYHVGDFCIMTSNWCVVAVTVFRFIAVYFPLQAGHLCTKTRARITIVLIYITALLLSLPEWLAKYLDTSTGMFHYYTETVTGYSTMYIVFMHTAPWILSAVFVTLLVCGLRRTGRMSAASHASTQQHERLARDQQRLSIMLVAIVAWFVCCTCPSVVYSYLYVVYGYKPETAMALDIQLVFYVIQYLGVILNHAGNFFFYTIINKNYRDHFCGVLTRRKSIKQWIGATGKSGGRVTTATTYSSVHSQSSATAISAVTVENGNGSVGSKKAVLGRRDSGDGSDKLLGNEEMEDVSL